jgi:hypothetical protein
MSSRRCLRPEVGGTASAGQPAGIGSNGWDDVRGPVAPGWLAGCGGVGSSVRQRCCAGMVSSWRGGGVSGPVAGAAGGRPPAAAVIGALVLRLRQRVAGRPGASLAVKVWLADRCPRPSPATRAPRAFHLIHRQPAPTLAHSASRVTGAAALDRRLVDHGDPCRVDHGVPGSGDRSCPPVSCQASSASRNAPCEPKYLAPSSEATAARA